MPLKYPIYQKKPLHALNVFNAGNELKMIFKMPLKISVAAVTERQMSAYRGCNT